MNIVKDFADQEFFCHPMISSPEFHGKFEWYWGLGSDGELYYRCTRLSDPDEWHRLTNSRDIAVLISLKTMKKLVKHFGHLLVFT